MLRKQAVSAEKPLTLEVCHFAVPAELLPPRMPASAINAVNPNLRKAGPLLTRNRPPIQSKLLLSPIR